MVVLDRPRVPIPGGARDDHRHPVQCRRRAVAALRDGVLLAEERVSTRPGCSTTSPATCCGGTTMIECFTLLGALAAATTTHRAGQPGGQRRQPQPRRDGAERQRRCRRSAAGGSRWAWAPARHRTRRGRPSTVCSASISSRPSPRVTSDSRRGLDEIDRWWSPDRPSELAPFPLPIPRPPVVLGVNSVPLATIAGARCDGLNVRASHPDLGGADRGRPAGATPAYRRGRSTAVRRLGVGALGRRAGRSRASRPGRWQAMGVNRLVMVWLQPHDPAAVARFLR